ncbi:hypothetical protein J1614_001416 [Plenodomus biglobosus]|nr:hypothetical protein J1614_001416 [Plenodomus biglobosus]
MLRTSQCDCVASELRQTNVIYGLSGASLLASPTAQQERVKCGSEQKASRLALLYSDDADKTVSKVNFKPEQSSIIEKALEREKARLLAEKAKNNAMRISSLHQQTTPSTSHRQALPCTTSFPTNASVKTPSSQQSNINVLQQKPPTSNYKSANPRSP